MYWTEELFSKRIVPLLPIHLKPTWQTGPEHNLFYLHLLKKKGIDEIKNGLRNTFIESNIFFRNQGLTRINTHCFLQMLLYTSNNPIFWIQILSGGPLIGSVGSLKIRRLFSLSRASYIFFFFSACVYVWPRNTTSLPLSHFPLCCEENPMCRYYALLDLLVW